MPKRAWVRSARIARRRRNSSQEESKTMAQNTIRDMDASELKVHYDRLVGRLKARGISYHDADNLAMHALCEGLDVQNLLKPQALLFRIALNRLYTLGRRMKTAAKHRQAFGRHAARIREQAVVDPVAEAIHCEEAEMLPKIMHEALATLPALDGEILMQQVYTDATYEELAQRFDLTHAAVKGRLRRARERLREYLERRL